MKSAAKIISALAAILCVPWYFYQPGFRPVFAGLMALATLFGLLVSDRRNEQKMRRRERAAQAAYNRIDSELSNFAELADGGRDSYNSDLHRKAATVYPYEKSLEDIQKLRDSGKYPILSRRLIYHLEREHPQKVLKLMKRLRSKLEKEPYISV